MTTLYAKGLVKGDTHVMYLWGYGNFKYEIERIAALGGGINRCEVFEASFDEAMRKFKERVDKVVLLWYYGRHWDARHCAIICWM